MEIHSGRLISGKEIPWWIYRFRTYLAIPPLLFALLWRQNRIEVEGLIWPVGIGLFLIGMAIRIWAQQHLHHRLKVHKHLTFTGPYQFVRNPLYIGNIIICVALTTLSELLWFIPVTLVWCLGTYSLVIRYEEARIVARYGEEARRYLSEVPRWIPKRVRFKNIKLVNEFLGRAFLIELPCWLLLFPYILKEIIS